VRAAGQGPCNCARMRSAVVRATSAAARTTPATALATSAMARAMPKTPRLTSRIASATAATARADACTGAAYVCSGAGDARNDAGSACKGAGDTSNGAVAVRNGNGAACNDASDVYNGGPMPAVLGSEVIHFPRLPVRSIWHDPLGRCSEGLIKCALNQRRLFMVGRRSKCKAARVAVVSPFEANSGAVCFRDGGSARIPDRLREIHRCGSWRSY
jgi:hypothetical protein